MDFKTQVVCRPKGERKLLDKLIGLGVFSVLMGGYVLLQQSLKTQGPDTVPVLLKLAWVGQLFINIAVLTLVFAVPFTALAGMDGLRGAVRFGAFIGLVTFVSYLLVDPTETGWPPFVNSRVVHGAEQYRLRHNCPACGSSSCLQDKHWIKTLGEFWWASEE